MWAKVYIIVDTFWKLQFLYFCQEFTLEFMSLLWTISFLICYLHLKKLNKFILREIVDVCSWMEVRTLVCKNVMSIPNSRYVTSLSQVNIINWWWVSDFSNGSSSNISYFKLFGDHNSLYNVIISTYSNWQTTVKD